MHYEFEQLGQIMVKRFGMEACQRAYHTSDVGLIGHSGVVFGDINADGSLNR